MPSDTYNVERFDFGKGSNSLIFGAVETGGQGAAFTKRPQARNFGEVLAFLRANAFPLLVTGTGGALHASHLPVLVREEGDALFLDLHMARSNPQWKEFFDEEVLVVFSGPHAYVSPRWYEEKQRVPTWNYAAVHAYGRARVIEDESALRELPKIEHRTSYLALLSNLAMLSGRLAAKAIIEGMAERGITGVKENLEGQDGLFNVYFAGKYDRAKLLGELGSRFEGDNVSFKAWPFCRRAHPAITAVIELLKKHPIAPESVQQIIADTNAASHPLCVPPESRVEPKTLLDAKFIGMVRDAVKNAAGVNQRLRRNASAVEAHTAHFGLVDHRHLATVLGQANRADITGRAGTHHDDKVAWRDVVHDRIHNRLIRARVVRMHARVRGAKRNNELSAAAVNAVRFSSRR